MPHASRWIRAVGLRVLVPVGLVLSLAGCPGTGTPEDPSTPGSSPSPDATTTEPVTRSPGPPVTGPALGPVTVTRSGGFAGVMQIVRIGADGSWTYTEGRGGTPTRGRLTEAERGQLASLVGSAAFAREARLRPEPGQCNDTFVYSITVGEFNAQYDDCDTAGKRPAVKAVVDLLIAATAL